jgi:hypothetical protein
MREFAAGDPSILSLAVGGVIRIAALWFFPQAQTPTGRLSLNG